MRAKPKLGFMTMGVFRDQVVVLGGLTNVNTLLILHVPKHTCLRMMVTQSNN